MKYCIILYIMSTKKVRVVLRPKVQVGRPVGPRVTSNVRGKFSGYAKKSKKKPFKKVPNSRAILKMVKFNSMTWKSFRQEYNILLDLSAIPAASCRALCWSLIDNRNSVTPDPNDYIGIPRFNQTSITVPLADPEQTRVKNAIFLKRYNCQFNFNSTLDRQMYCRFLILRNTGEQKMVPAYRAPGTPGYPLIQDALGISNLYQDYVSKTPTNIILQNGDAVGISVMNINEDLFVKKKSDILVDKVLELGAYSAGNPTSDTLGKYNFSIPINKWVSFEDDANNYSTTNCKQGSYYAIMVFGSAAPVAGSGGINGRYHHAITWME